jgi:type VI secretion system secreted protein VgrG
VRVASNWSGKNWGLVSTPRIGQEVLIDFLEGDPDRPIITGQVYNAEQTPPFGTAGTTRRAASCSSSGRRKTSR